MTRLFSWEDFQELSWNVLFSLDFLWIFLEMEPGSRKRACPLKKRCAGHPNIIYFFLKNGIFFYSVFIYLKRIRIKFKLFFFIFSTSLIHLEVVVMDCVTDFNFQHDYRKGTCFGINNFSIIKTSQFMNRIC